MATCIQPTSTFVAETGNASGIREGWLAEAADDLILAKRYVGLDATNDDGRLVNVLHDCEHDCEGRGGTYSQASDGKLKGRAAVTIPLQPCIPSDTGVRVRFTSIPASCNSNFINGVTYTLSKITCPPPHATDECCFRAFFGSSVSTVFLNFGSQVCVWFALGTPGCTTFAIREPLGSPCGNQYTLWRPDGVYNLSPESGPGITGRIIEFV